MNVEAIEGIRQVLATYTQALDDGRTDDVVATFCADGSCDLPGLGHFAGHDALREAYRQVEPRRPQRHLVLNTRIAELTDHEATAVSDVVFLLRRSEGWSVQLVGRYTDSLHRTDSGWLFHHRAAEFS